MSPLAPRLAAAALALAAALAAVAPARAGTGGSAAGIAAAVASGSTDAIVAEVERAEGLVCPACVAQLTALTEDPRPRVREVAAWWFAKRPALRDALVQQMVDDLATGDAVRVRNAADFVGAVGAYAALPALRGAIGRGDAAARLAVVGAARALAHVDGNPVLVAAMTDGDARVRAAAVAAWREVLGQRGAQPVIAALADADAGVRAQAAQVVGAMGESGGRAALESLVAGDPSPVVRRNAAWALGQLGAAASRPALEAATRDPSGLVSLVARAALARLR